jgi:hypothetical protein
VVVGKVYQSNDDDPSVRFEVLLTACPVCRSAIVAGRSMEQ